MTDSDFRKNFVSSVKNKINKLINSNERINGIDLDYFLRDIYYSSLGFKIEDKLNDEYFDIVLRKEEDIFRYPNDYNYENLVDIYMSLKIKDRIGIDLISFTELSKDKIKIIIDKVKEDIDKENNESQDLINNINKKGVTGDGK